MRPVFSCVNWSEYLNIFLSHTNLTDLKSNKRQVYNVLIEMQDMPRIFVQEYGILLLENVHLLMPDVNEFCVKFSESIGQLTGLDKLLLKYSFKEHYVIFFDYIGRSHFLQSVYTEKGDDVFAYLRRKVMLQHIMHETECPISRSLDRSLEAILPSRCNSNVLFSNLPIFKLTCKIFIYLLKI